VEKMLKVLGTVVGGEVEGVVVTTFRAMKTAEVEIARFKTRHPDHGEDLDRAFLCLQPPVSFWSKSDALYRAHCRELLGRVVRGEDLRTGTSAEVLVAILEVATRTPIRPDFVLAADRVFEDVYGETAKKVIGPVKGVESYEGAVDEIVSDLRRRLGNPDRVINP